MSRPSFRFDGPLSSLFSWKAVQATPTMMTTSAQMPKPNCQPCVHSWKNSAPSRVVNTSCMPVDSGMARATPR